MTEQGRASMFEAAPDLDLAGFKPRARPKPDGNEQRDLEDVAERTGFVAREPVSRPGVNRRRVTSSRIAQLNVKVTEEELARFYDLVNSSGKTLGAVFSDMLDALDEKRRLIK